MKYNNTNILWLSDIHIKKTEFEKYDIHSYFQEVVCFVIEKYSTLHYLIISGDIAYSGLEEEYDLFNKHFIEQIKKHYSDIIILSIPGNHDIIREKLDQYEDKFFTNDFIKRNEFIIEKDESCFENYVKFFEDNVLPSLKNNNNIIHSFNIEESKRTLGYIIDKNRKLCFILVNTAWLSFGNNAINKFIESYLKNKNDTTRNEETLKNILDFPEYSSQMIGNDFIKNLKLDENVFDKYKEYTIVSIMHHPQNWLHYEEQYSENIDTQKKLPLNYIKHNSHVILTGHEHIPHFANEIKTNNPIHFMGGCFIDDYKIPFNDQKNNRFNVLEIIKNVGASFIKNTDYGINVIEKEGEKKTYITELNLNRNQIYLKKKIYYPKNEGSCKKEEYLKTKHNIKDLSYTDNNIITYYINENNKCIFSVVDYSEFIKKDNEKTFYKFISKNLLYDKIDITIYLTDEECGYKENQNINIEEEIRLINEMYDEFKIKKEDLFNKYKHLILKNFFDNFSLKNFNKISIKFHLEKQVKIF